MLRLQIICVCDHYTELGRFSNHILHSLGTANPHLANAILLSCRLHILPRYSWTIFLFLCAGIQFTISFGHWPPSVIETKDMMIPSQQIRLQYLQTASTSRPAPYDTVFQHVNLVVKDTSSAGAYVSCLCLITDLAPLHKNYLIYKTTLSLYDLIFAFNRFYLYNRTLSER